MGYRHTLPIILVCSFYDCGYESDRCEQSGGSRSSVKRWDILKTITVQPLLNKKPRHKETYTIPR